MQQSASNIIENRKSPIQPDTGKSKKYNVFMDIKRNNYSYILVLPAIIYTIIFGYLTYPYMVIAFQRFNYKKGIFRSEWIGFKNFEFFFKSNYAFHVTWNTIKLNILFILFVTFFSVAFALMLNELKCKWFLRINQSVMLFPSYLSWVVVSYMLYGLFSMDFGIVNQYLKSFGLESINWYAKPEAWPWILVGMRVWKGTGMQAVIFLAAITGIDDSLYESAMIDGANRWQQTKSITLPLIAPTVAILTLLSIGKIMYGDFGMIYAIVNDNGVLYPTTDVIDTYVFRALRQIGDPAEAMAIGMFQSVVGFLMVYGSNWLTRRFFREGALY